MIRIGYACRLGLISAGFAATMLPREAAAEPVRWHIGAGLGHAVGGHQQKEFTFGGAVFGAAELPINASAGAHLSVSSVVLGAGDAPDDPSLKPLGTGVSNGIGLGLRLYPLRSEDNDDSSGPWLAGSAGVSVTGGETKQAIDAHIGYDFAMSGGALGFGPAVSWMHIFQPDDAVRPNDANILFVGVHGVFRQPRDELKEAVDGDKDQDGIKDSVDQCPNDPEDKDGFEDEDGCPELDNDGDGVLDTPDQCDDKPEDKDGFEDEDGCPDPDNDEDGILDMDDACPDDAEDKDGFEDDDGCPDKDNDKDGFPDKSDVCPDEPETKNGYADHDGCPDEQQVRVVGDKIVLDDRIHFRTNNHKIRPVSYPLLERLAKLIKDHPEYVHTRVEGHTDARGGDKYNMGLSERRAKSVLDFLVSRGVEAKRLSSIGFGSTKPLVDKRSERAWFLNRRVEFTVTRERKIVGGAKVEPPRPKNIVPKPESSGNDRPDVGPKGGK